MVKRRNGRIQWIIEGENRKRQLKKGKKRELINTEDKKKVELCVECGEKKMKIIAEGEKRKKDKGKKYEKCRREKK